MFSDKPAPNELPKGTSPPTAMPNLRDPVYPKHHWPDLRSGGGKMFSGQVPMSAQPHPNALIHGYPQPYAVDTATAELDAYWMYSEDCADTVNDARGHFPPHAPATNAN